jgi:hypothetical protein
MQWAPYGALVSLQLFNAAVLDDSAVALLSCDSTTVPPVPPVSGINDPCFSATVEALAGPAPATNTFTATVAPTATATPMPPITALAVGGVAKRIDTAALPSTASAAPGDRQAGYVNAGIAVMAAVAAAGGVWVAWRWVKPGE